MAEFGVSKKTISLKVLIILLINQYPKLKKLSLHFLKKGTKFVKIMQANSNKQQKLT